jgi:hypothetical protein
MAEIMRKAGENVKIKAEQHNPAALGRTGYSPAEGQGRWYAYREAVKRQTCPAASAHPFAYTITGSTTLTTGG